MTTEKRYSNIKIGIHLRYNTVMEVKFTDTFFESLKRLAWQQHPIYKCWELFRYNIPAFFVNIWRFRKSLWRFRWYDDSYPLMMFKNSLEIMAPRFEVDGLEEGVSRMKKVSKMYEAIQLMQNFIDDNFIDQAEKELGDIFHRDWNFDESPNDSAYSILMDSVFCFVK